MYTSTPFKFVIDGQSFFIHPPIVAQHSKPLHRMISGQLSEAQQGFALLEDVDPGTFDRYCDWAYTGKYDAATVRVIIEDDMRSSISDRSEVVEKRSTRDSSPESILSSPRAEASEPTILSLLDTTGWHTRYIRDHLPVEEVQTYPRREEKPYLESDMGVEFTSPKLFLKESFIRYEYAVPETHSPPPPPRQNQDRSEDYTEVFLSHAKLYVFADKYDIQPLKSLAIRNLHQTLAIFTLYPERVGDITELLFYAYDNTSSLDDGIEDLRKLLLHYVGCEMDLLVKDQDFEELLARCEAFLGDFLKIVGVRINV